MKLLIGNKIKQLRLNKNITQEQLAEAMNVSCAAVSKWERGETYPDITLLQPLAYYFNVSLDELMEYNTVKLEHTIQTILDQYTALYRKDPDAARQLIIQAKNDYPNDYRILHCYMWNLAGDYADNDPQTLLCHKEEFLSICNKILHSCEDSHIRLDAFNMQAKLAHAEGRTKDALAIYQNHFFNWYETSGQKSEQLFAKHTPEFSYWIHKNLYELASFAADKLVKAYLFGDILTIEEKLNKLEYYGDFILKFAIETKEAFFAILAKSLFERLCNDLRYRNLGNTDADIIRITDKYLASIKITTELSETDAVLYEVTTAMYHTDKLLPWIVQYYLSAKHGKNAELLENTDYVQVLKRYKELP